MVKIAYLTCPQCGTEFYITDEFASQGYDWCCPKCEHTFKEHESLSAPGRRPPGEAPHKM